jgi:tetratricopeptide (TPR) repeat protein
VSIEESSRDVLSAGAEALTEAAFRTGEFATAEQILNRALDLARVQGDRSVEAAALDRLGWLVHFRALDQGVEQVDAATVQREDALFQQAMTIFEEIGDPGGLAAALFGRGLVRQVLRRDWEGAMPLYQRALDLVQDNGDRLTRSEVHRHIGFFHMVREQFEAGLHHLRTSLELREQHGDPRWIASGTLAVGQAELIAGRPAVASCILREAVRQSKQARLRPQRVAQAELWLRHAEVCQVPLLD